MMKATSHFSRENDGMATAVAQLTNRFAPTSLAEMKQAALLKRTDTKFVMSIRQLYQALDKMSDRYRVLDIDGKRLHRYQTLYFDTEHFALYRRHHSGGLNRHKLRYRKYVDSGLCYLEVKFKTNKRRTTKSRMRAADFATSFDARESAFIHQHFPVDPQDTTPTMWNDFWRMTLVSKFRTERLTIDLCVNVHCHDHSLAWPGVVIAEVKQPKLSLGSDFVQVMKALGVQHRGFSKYCMGVSMLYPGRVPGNNFKPNLMLVSKLTAGGGENHERLG